MPVVAFCTDIPEFHEGRIFDSKYAELFPGAAVFPPFAQSLRELGWEVVTGDQLGKSATDPHMEEVFVLQEEDSAIGQHLRDRGAIPALILSGESPLYARDFYRHIGASCKPFPHRILFTGAHSAAGDDGINHPLLFPAFHAERQQGFVPWADRKHLVLLAGNKYWRHNAIPWPQRLRRLARETYDRTNASWLKENQLHDRRLDLIAHFSAQGSIDIFGSGWQNRSHLPRVHQRALTDLVSGGSVSPGSSPKHDLLSSYRYTLTLENFRYPGYVTEKIFDALAAGSIPVYLGAPDIESFVPREAFIDIQDFASPKDLNAFLNELDEESANSILQQGRDFLHSSRGLQHSFEDRGRFIASLLEQVASET